MSGGITQLVATGVQDAYLSGSPEVSFFRSTYKRYTHFASTVERQLIQGNPVSNAVSTVRFEKKGDLLSQVYITAIDSTQASIPNVNWAKVIDKIELLIGGQIIDTQDEFFTSSIEPVTGAQTFSSRYIRADDTTNVFYPLKFFFCKDWQSALPLIALQFHDVELRITWGSDIAGDVSASSFAVWSRFIYLDKDEREFFAKKSHDMLITQVTRSPITFDRYNYEFALSQPVKYIAFRANDYITKYNAGGSSRITAQGWTFKVQINGNDIGETKTLDHWVNANQFYLTPFGYRADGNLSNVAIIPFCLDTAKLQPTGTINFSRIDTFRLIAPPSSKFIDSNDSNDGTTTTNGIVNKLCRYFYAVNYNILRIQNGMAGILYAS